MKEHERTMATTKETSRRPTPTSRTTLLGPGCHAATIELKTGAAYRVKLLDGRRAKATIACGVSAKLIDACLHSRRTVMLADGDRGPVVIGVLLTAPVPEVHGETGVFEVNAQEVVLRADASLVLQVGASRLTLDKSGVARVDGERLVIDVSTLLRVLATKAELP